jgi:hypothetical protein
MAGPRPAQWTPPSPTVCVPEPMSPVGPGCESVSHRLCHSVFVSLPLSEPDVDKRADGGPSHELDLAPEPAP